MEEMLKSIAEAEAQAEALRNNAQTRAAEIAAEALNKAAALQKQTESECKAFREQQLALASQTADEEYKETLTKSKEAAKKYADELIENTEAYVRNIIGRTCGDR